MDNGNLNGILPSYFKMWWKLVNSLVAVVVAVSPLAALACEFHSEPAQTAFSSLADPSSHEKENHHHGIPASPADHHSPSGPETNCIAQQHAVVSGQFLTAVDLQGLPESELEVGHSGPVERFTPIELPRFPSPKPVPLVLRI